MDGNDIPRWACFVNDYTECEGNRMYGHLGLGKNVSFCNIRRFAASRVCVRLVLTLELTRRFICSTLCKT